MLLFHGSNMEIGEVDLAKSRPYKDFGKAFYLSTDKSQALEMARFKVLTQGGTETITVFDFDDNAVEGLKIKHFDGYTLEWAEFVFNNRDERTDFRHDFDIVYGPIANDTVGVQIRDLRERKISMDAFLKNLEYKKGITFQYAFCSPLAISKLKRL
ncbi:MAG: DUF3990 domain-containing protein [Salinivirgaceae bacterium]|nr:DUF3990 domain-containing protein [Salinivirgaceae bacterium]